jgi:putative flippase GtrA
MSGAGAMSGCNKMDASSRALGQHEVSWIARLIAPLKPSLSSLIQIKFVRYAAVGASAALIQLILLSLCVEVLQMPLVVASTAALSVSVSFNYYMQRLITFRSAAKHYIAGPKFFFIAGCTLATNTHAIDHLPAKLQLEQSDHLPVELQEEFAPPRVQAFLLAFSRGLCFRL